jgi:hypothetical protein
MPNGSNSFSYDLFLSYKSADYRIVEEVARRLAAAGLKELFIDWWNLPVGTRWRPMLAGTPRPADPALKPIEPELRGTGGFR